MCSFFFHQALSQSTHKRPIDSNYHKAECTFCRHFQLARRKQLLAAMFTSCHCLPLTWDRWIQTTISLTFSVWSKLMPHTVRFSNQNFESLSDISPLCYTLLYSHLRKIRCYHYACSTAHEKFFINQFSPALSLFIHSPFDTTKRFFIRRRAVAKLRQVAISFVTSVRRELGSHWTDFYEIWYLNIFQNLSRKIQVSLNSDKDNGYLYGDYIYFWSYLA